MVDKYEFGVYRSIVNRNKWQIEMKMYKIKERVYHPYERYSTQYVDIDEEICKYLNLTLSTYIEQANKYGGKSELNPWIEKNIVLFNDKQSAKKFITKYLESSVLPLLSLI